MDTVAVAAEDARWVVGGFAAEDAVVAAAAAAVDAAAAAAETGRRSAWAYPGSGERVNQLGCTLLILLSPGQPYSLSEKKRASLSSRGAT